MPLPRLFLTTTFRLALIYLGLFLILVLFLLGFVYWSTSDVADRQIDDTIEAEITGLAEQYRLRGLGGLSDVVERSPCGHRGPKRPTSPTVHTVERGTAQLTA